MNYLLVSIISAFAIAISVYAETSSILLSLIAYSLTGTVVLSTVLVSGYFDMRADDSDEATG